MEKLQHWTTVRNEWKIYSHSAPTNTFISYATWVILLDVPSQHDDASLLLLAYHEIFMASFVCLCKAQKCHNSGPHPAPPQHLSFSFGISGSVLSPSCASYHVLVWKESLFLLNTGIFPTLTVDRNSRPFPLFFSILTQTLRNTNFLCNQCNWTTSWGIYSTNLY